MEMARATIQQRNTPPARLRIVCGICRQAARMRDGIGAAAEAAEHNIIGWLAETTVSAEAN
jgi:hypothetical protein